MLSYIDLERPTHHRKHPNIKVSFRDSGQLGLVKTPTIEGVIGARVLDIHCRFFTDDIPYGLLLAKWVAEQLDIKTLHLDEWITWGQTLREEHWSNEDKTIEMMFCMNHKELTGLPPSHGIDNVNDILD